MIGFCIHGIWCGRWLSIRIGDGMHFVLVVSDIGHFEVVVYLERVLIVYFAGLGFMSFTVVVDVF